MLRHYVVCITLTTLLTTIHTPHSHSFITLDLCRAHIRFVNDECVSGPFTLYVCSLWQHNCVDKETRGGIPKKFEQSEHKLVHSFCHFRRRGAKRFVFFEPLVGGLLALIEISSKTKCANTLWNTPIHTHKMRCLYTTCWIVSTPGAKHRFPSEKLYSYICITCRRSLGIAKWSGFIVVFKLSRISASDVHTNRNTRHSTQIVQIHQSLRKVDAMKTSCI